VSRPERTFCPGDVHRGILKQDQAGDRQTAGKANNRENHRLSGTANEAEVTVAQCLPPLFFTCHFPGRGIPVLLEDTLAFIAEYPVQIAFHITG
jgi:hypothetical protein